MREIIGINPYDTQQRAFELEVEVNQPEQQLIKSKFEGQLTQKYSLNKPDVTFKMKEEKEIKKDQNFCNAYYIKCMHVLKILYMIRLKNCLNVNATIYIYMKC